MPLFGKNKQFKIFVLILLFSNTLLYGFRNNEGIIVKLSNSKMRIEIITPTIIRVSVTADSDFSKVNYLAVLPLKPETKFETEERSRNILIKTDSLLLAVNKFDGSVIFYNTRNKIILRSCKIDKDSFKRDSSAGESDLHIMQKFELTAGEGIYGLGQFEDPFMNYRGHDILIVQANRTAVNPFLVSTNGYGILWNNDSQTEFHDDKNTTYFKSETARQIDYYFVYGPSIDNEIAGYRYLTGQAPLFGKWAYGYWQSKERYKTFNELINVVREYRNKKIPLDNIVQDWQYWGNNGNFSGMTWDPVRYPEPKMMIDSLHKLHAHLMVSIWPAFGKESKIYKEMGKDKFLFSPLHWCGGKVYDAWNPEARDLYWKYIRKGLFDDGVDAFWMDGTEPEFRCTDDRYITMLSLKNAGNNYLGSNSEYLNTYSLATTTGVYEHQRETTGKKRVFILTRSAFAGQQRNAAVTWSGDTFADWNVLKIQVAAGINFCMSGIPYWTDDIGGFITSFNFPNGLKDDAYKELYVRWFEFGAFCPIFRSHGTNIPREIWRFGSKGDPAYDALVKFDNLRYRLMPYIYSVAWMVTDQGYTMMRGLPMDFTSDKNTYSIGTQYMFGPSIMVCPVLKPLYHMPAYKGIDITPDHFYSPGGKEHGARLTIYKGTEFNKIVLSRKFEASQISWIGCLPETLDTSYSLKIEGQIKSEEKGNYKFIILTDGGIKFWINDKLIIDKWNNKDSAEFESKINLSAGTKYNFKLYHRQFRPKTAFLKINWIKPDTCKHPGKIRVYLPKNNFWYDFWTGDTVYGGRTVLLRVPEDMMPLYVPDGSIVPLGPGLQYADDRPADPLELRIYPGKDDQFNLYEDENDNYNYEKGIYSVIPFIWHEKKKTLTIGNRKGAFPGMLKKRTFNIIIVGKGHGGGAASTVNPDKSVIYSGKEINIKF